jgi:hypothetical protein
MTPQERKVMELALKALGENVVAMRGLYGLRDFTTTLKAFKALEEALAQPEKLPKCFADFQHNHVADRMCGYCPLFERCTLAQPEQCTGCEGKPSNANNPCAVCGKSQPEQEPVAFVKGCNRGQWEIFPAKAHQIFGIDQPLYTTPPQRKPLTDEEIGAILEGVNAYGTRLYTFARAIEAKLKELNK